MNDSTNRSARAALLPALFRDGLMFLAALAVSLMGAAHNQPFVGPAVVGVLLVVQTFVMSDPVRQLRFVFTAAVLGTVIESTSMAAGLYVPADPLRGGWLCPLWITGLWVSFAALVCGGLAPLRGQLVWAAAAGAIAGPAVYTLAAWLGAITVGVRPEVALPLWSMLWAWLLPALLWLTGTPFFASTKVT